jgi:hypothetical protein
VEEGSKDIVVTPMNKGILNHHLPSSPLAPPEVGRIAGAHDALVAMCLQHLDEALRPLSGLKNHVVSNLKEVLMSIGHCTLKQLIPHTSRRMLASGHDTNLESAGTQVVCIPKKEDIIVVDAHIDLVLVCRRPCHLEAGHEGTDQVTILKSLPGLVATADRYENSNTHASRL